jgi:integrase
MTPKRRNKGDGTLFKRADGMYVGRVELPSLDGKRRQKTVASRNRNTAMTKLRELKAAISAGAIPVTGTTTVEKWMHHWLETIHGPTVKPTTLTSYSNTVRLYIVPTIGPKRLDRLTPEDVRRMHRALQESSTRNAQKAHQVLQSGLKAAVNEGLLVRNVAEVVAKPKHVKITREALSPEVALLLIRTAETSRDEMWAARWAVGIMTGARESEVLGLTWDRVDLQSNRIDYSWQLQTLKKKHGCGQPVDGRYPCGKVRFSRCPQAHWAFPPGFEYRECEGNELWTRPKTTRSNRGVPIIPPLRVALERLKAMDGYNPHQLVFHHETGRPFTQSQDQAAWRALLVDAGVPPVSQHVLRHTAATLMRRAQVDEQTRQELFGHTTADIQRGYAHGDDVSDLDAMGRFADLLTMELD